ncbi:hypothetical protein HY495_02290 [Candidatus Woesearchaeota archaeon]|nr:hypothetical protein [Candidatus Woesearchaeota archaeon]
MGGGTIWDYYHPIRYLPGEIASAFSTEADFLRRDLDDNRLRVTLKPADEEHYTGHKIRVVESTNPQWYRELYLARMHLKRQRSLRSLERLSRGDDLPYLDRRGAVSPFGSYDSLYREMIQGRLINGYEVDDGFIPEQILVKRFFSCGN